MITLINAEASEKSQHPFWIQVLSKLRNRLELPYSDSVGLQDPRKHMMRSVESFSFNQQQRKGQDVWEICVHAVLLIIIKMRDLKVSRGGFVKFTKAHPHNRTLCTNKMNEVNSYRHGRTGICDNGKLHRRAFIYMYLYYGGYEVKHIVQSSLRLKGIHQFLYCWVVPSGRLQMYLHLNVLVYS